VSLSADASVPPNSSGTVRSRTPVGRRFDGLPWRPFGGVVPPLPVAEVQRVGLLGDELAHLPAKTRLLVAQFEHRDEVEAGHTGRYQMSYRT
jgi:hypothetical protein